MIQLVLDFTNIPTHLLYTLRSRQKVISLKLATMRTQEWRGHSYALDLRGRREKYGTPP